MTLKTTINLKNIIHLKDLYDLKFKETIMRDDDHAYQWMMNGLSPSYIEGKKILDLGCGAGYFLKFAQKKAQEAHGSDLSGEALKIAQSNGNKLLAQSSAEQLPYRNHFFDTLFCLGTLQLFPNRDQAIKEMTRVIKKEGWIILMVPNAHWYKDFFCVLTTGKVVKRDVPYEFIGSLKQWSDLLQTNQLLIKKVWKYNGISKSIGKQFLKDLLIPLNVSYQFIFACQVAPYVTD